MKKEIFIFIFICLLLVSFVSANEKISKNLNSEKPAERILVNVLLKEKPIEKNSIQYKKIKVDEPYLSKKVLREFKSSNGFSANLTYEEILDLSKNPEVSFIREVRKFKISLLESNNLLNTSTVWRTQISSTNLTGVGQTVCIIDTGINFSHEDLSSNYLGGYDFVNNDDDPSDDHGHGTHVAGIVASNGLLKGISPETKLIVIKALDSDGSGNDNDIVAGIDWCVTNSSEYNISVISMSLGSECPGDSCYSSSCDSSPLETLMVNAINSAVAKNISVVVASGNDANYTHISSPACVSNATAVGDTYDENVGGKIWSYYLLNGTFIETCRDTTSFQDKLVCHANRNSLVRLFAPGAIINSTWFDGTYREQGGTSMATPMVAGAIAIINQKLELTAQSKTPSEIEQLLYDTGKILEDDESGLNFSRINILAAIEAINDSILAIENLAPANETYTNLLEVNFSCSAQTSGDSELSNLSLRIWNSSELIYTNSSNVSGTTNSSYWTYTLPSEAIYFWNCEVFSNNSRNYTGENYTITYDSISPNISEISISVTSSSANLNWNTSEETNATISYGSNVSNSSFSQNHSQTILGLSASTSYSYNLTYCDRAGNCNSSAGNFTTSAAEVRRSSGGGGGGGSKPLVINSSQIEKGLNKNFYVTEKLNFVLNNENHSLQLNKIFNNSANLTLRSEPKNFVISVGEEEKFNFSSLEYYDLVIKLENITQNKANISIRSIKEPIFKENRFRIQNETEDIKDFFEEEKRSENYSWILLFLFFLVILVGVVIWKELKRRNEIKKYEEA